MCVCIPGNGAVGVLSSLELCSYEPPLLVVGTEVHAGRTATFKFKRKHVVAYCQPALSAIISKLEEAPTAPGGDLACETRSGFELR